MVCLVVPWKKGIEPPAFCRMSVIIAIFKLLSHYSALYLKQRKNAFVYQ